MEDEIRKALEVLRAGGTILYPTDTIWGIGCDATNEIAVERILTIKKRATAAPALKGENIIDERSNTNSPSGVGGKSLIILVSDDGMLNRFVKNIPALAWDLMDLTDTPLTIIYDGGRGLAKNVFAEDGSIGVRKVTDTFCHRLIHKFGKPVVSTSANISNEPAPKNYSEIMDEIKQSVDYVVNWKQDEWQSSKASSIIKLKENGEIKIIRK